MPRDAKAFATRKHAGQYRKGPHKDPYITHPERVAQLVRKYKGTSKSIDDLEAAAWLHDTIEDTDTTYEEIEQEFGPMVADLVQELTSEEDYIARHGKTAYLKDKLKGMSNYALVVKLADRLDNVSDLEEADPDWAKRYARQTQDLIDHIVDERDLTSTQLAIIDNILQKIHTYL